MTHISIGILAYNEAAIIQSTLDALLTQSVFQDPHITSEIVVVPNGCTDDTAAIAEAYLKGTGDRLNASKVSWKVCNLPQAGLANAWNTFIHELSSPSADYLFVMSSDIRLIEPETFRSMVRILEDRPEAWVSVDQRIKDVAFKENKTPADWLSLWISKISGGHSVEGEPAWISGQLSCTRTAILRKLWLPLTLPTDDSFFYTMVVTNFLTEPPKPERVLLAPAAAHTFEAYTSVRKLFKHEKWLIFGAAVNELLYTHLQQFQPVHNSDICSSIRESNQKNPVWLNEMVRKVTLNSHGWFIPKFILIRRFQSLRSTSLAKAVIMLPLSVAAFLVDATLAFQVNTEMNKSGGLSTWKGSGSWGKE